MILQNCMLPDEVCSIPEIYYRSSEEGLRSDCGHAILKAGEELGSDTYMNMLDVSAWKKYTTVSRIRFQCGISGRGTIALIHQENNIKKKISEISYDCPEPGIHPSGFKELTLQINVPSDLCGGTLSFHVKAKTKTVLYHAEYETDALPEREVSLSLVICTYKRKEALEKNIERLKSSAFFQHMTEKERFVVRIVDNAKELSDTYGPHIHVYPNENTGGSGGFTRGMEESVSDRLRCQTTHVVLMDDDVELQAESLSRLYALLSYMKPEFRRESVAGRMFRLDDRKIQYTAAEIWNGGDLRHIGLNHDMTRPENLPSVNDNTGAEYGGWWFDCYPIEFVEQNKPLPFFLHCDDVEYGLRHGGTPIILNGIQVWHETYEYRQSPVIAYYDTRNALIVNRIFGISQKKEEVLYRWKTKLSSCHVRGDYLSERMVMLGMLDYIRSKSGHMNINLQSNHRRISRKRYFVRLTNKFLWRMIEVLYQKKFK